MPKKSRPDLVADSDDDDTIELVEIPFRGRAFTIPVDMDEWEIEACLALKAGEYVLAAKLLLGPRQWRVLQSLGSKRKDIREFLVVFADVVDEKCRG